MRDSKTIESFLQKKEKENKQKNMFQNLRNKEKIMEGLLILDKLKKRINATLQQVGETMISGGVDNMEKYKYLLGQAHAYQIILQEISNLLNKDKEQKEDGNVIDIKGSNKD